MNLVLYTHPDFVGSRSQQRFAHMLREAYASGGHCVELRQPSARLRRLLSRGGLAKWSGYVDQYVLFAASERRRIATDPPQTLYVFCDQALGPWVPLVAHRPHVVHCHDLLALRSALGDITEHPARWTGRLYQRFIRSGFRRARHFISISERTRRDLHRWGGVEAVTSEVVHNGLNHPYRPLEAEAAGRALRQAGIELGAAPFLLHVGGGQWYKNTAGVLALYAKVASRLAARGGEIPGLVLVGPHRDRLRDAQGLPSAALVHVVDEVSPPALQALYSVAEALLFPSLAEGYGWPIAEALACGCSVVTTGEAPMTEVGGDVAHYLPRLTALSELDAWAERGAVLVEALLDRDAAARSSDRAAGLAWARQFDPQRAVDAYLRIYEHVLAVESTARGKARVARTTVNR